MMTSDPAGRTTSVSATSTVNFRVMTRLADTASTSHPPPLVREPSRRHLEAEGALPEHSLGLVGERIGDLGMVREQVPGPGQRTGNRFVPRDKEGHQFIADRLSVDGPSVRRRPATKQVDEVSIAHAVTTCRTSLPKNGINCYIECSNRRVQPPISWGR